MQSHAPAFAVLVLAASFGVLGFAGEPSWTGASSPPPAQPAPAVAPGRCEVTTGTTSAPRSLRVTESVAVTHTLAVACGDSLVDVVLVIDASVAGNTSEDLLTWADDLVVLAKSLAPLVRVGVVAFSDEATTRCELTRDGDALHDCILGIATSGASHPEAGLREAFAMLERRQWSDPDLAKLTGSIVVLIVGGPPASSCSEVVSAAFENRVADLRLVVCGGSNCDAPALCWRGVAGPVHDGRYVFRIDEWDRFAATLAEMTAPLTPSTVVISTTLSTPWTLVSTAPPAEVEGQSFSWRMSAPANVITTTYHALARAPGRVVLNDVASAQVVVRRGTGRHIIRDVALDRVTVSVTDRLYLPILADRR